MAASLANISALIASVVVTATAAANPEYQIYDAVVQTGDTASATVVAAPTPSCPPIITQSSTQTIIVTDVPSETVVRTPLLATVPAGTS